MSIINIGKKPIKVKIILKIFILYFIYIIMYIIHTVGIIANILPCIEYPYAKKTPNNILFFFKFLLQFFIWYNKINNIIQTITLTQISFQEYKAIEKLPGYKPIKIDIVINNFLFFKSKNFFNILRTIQGMMDKTKEFNSNIPLYNVIGFFIDKKSKE